MVEFECTDSMIRTLVEVRIPVRQLSDQSLVLLLALPSHQPRRSALALPLLHPITKLTSLNQMKWFFGRAEKHGDVVPQQYRDNLERMETGEIPRPGKLDAPPQVHPQRKDDDTPRRFNDPGSKVKK